MREGAVSVDVSAGITEGARTAVEHDAGQGDVAIAKLALRLPVGASRRQIAEAMSVALSEYLR
jgi:hypothetical protein